MSEKNGPLAQPGDVSSINMVLETMYRCISFKHPGQPDWDRFRSLFAPWARFIHARPAGVEIMDLDAFVERYFEQIEAGVLQSFQERELGNRQERFGSVAHVFSTYEVRFVISDETQTVRGINTVQLLWNSDRWWIVSVLWDDETQEQPIPTEYLPAGV